MKAEVVIVAAAAAAVELVVEMVLAIRLRYHPKSVYVMIEI